MVRRTSGRLQQQQQQQAQNGHRKETKEDGKSKLKNGKEKVAEVHSSDGQDDDDQQQATVSSEDSDFEDIVSPSKKRRLAKAKTNPTKTTHPKNASKPKSVSKDDPVKRQPKPKPRKPAQKLPKKSDSHLACLPVKPSPKKAQQKPPQPGSDESESDWEEVEHPGPEQLDPEQQPGPSTDADTLTITVDKHKKKSKCESYVETFLRQEINRFRKCLLKDLHHVHLLFLLARQRHVSAVCNNRLLQARALSIVPDKIHQQILLTPNHKAVKALVSWFRNNGVALKLYKPAVEPHAIRVSDLEYMLEHRFTTSLLHLTCLFILVARACGLSVRLVSSLQPWSFKPSSDDKHTTTTAAAGSSNKQKAAGKKKSNPKSDKKPTVEKKAADSTVAEDGENRKDAPVRTGDHWAEVYVEQEETWIPVNVNFQTDSTGKTVEPVNMGKLIEKQCTQPVHYVLAADEDLVVRDVTWRYVQRFMSPAVRRLRTDQQDWWTETLESFASPHPLRDRLESMQRDDALRHQPLPSVVSEFKGHPLYVLRRDLLKFEALYPDSTPPVGYVRGEAVYPRTAVHLLHNKEGWMKKARVIKPLEEPYKIVKARPKMGVAKEDQVERPCPLYGLWQTTAYVPRPPIDGKIPRNEYGNVEIFQPCMQPPGTAHLRLHRLLDVAKKLDIDCAPVMAGWDFKGGRNAPVIDGYLVCEEHREAVVAAWQEEEQLRQQRARKRTEERALDNWKRLTKALLMRKKVNKKFTTQTRLHQSTADGMLSSSDNEEAAADNNNNGEASAAGKTKKPKATKRGKAAEKRPAWPSTQFSL